MTVVVLGEPASYSGEASSRSDIGLPGQQLALVQAIAQTGKPYVVVLMNGRPLTIPWLADNAPALLESWFPGTEGGDAIADVLFGKVNPVGKLPMSFPRNVGQIPISYNELPTGRPYDPNNKYTSKYLDVPNTPQYPFGYGLSYTTLLAIEPADCPRPAFRRAARSPSRGHHEHRVGRRRRRRAALLHESDTSILQPVRQARRLPARDDARAGTDADASPSRWTASNLGFYNDQGQFVVEPGPFDVWVGDSSVGGLHSTFTVR